MALIEKLAIRTGMRVVPDRSVVRFVGRNGRFAARLVGVMAMATTGDGIGVGLTSAMKSEEMRVVERRPKIQQKNQVACQNPSR